MLEGGGGVHSDLDAIEDQPVEGSDLSRAGGDGEVVGDDPDLDAAFVDGVEEGGEDGERFVPLCLDGAASATFTLLLVVSTVAPAPEACKWT